MQHAQFISLPPLNDIQDLFTRATGLPFQTNVSWSLWLPVDIDDILIFRPYIRPCHQKLLMDTINSVQKNACSLLRQLLRPYGFSIIKKKTFYTLVETKENVKGVGKKSGTTVVWTTPS
jgi:hypothetical protein